MRSCGALPPIRPFCPHRGRQFFQQRRRAFEKPVSGSLALLSSPYSSPSPATRPSQYQYRRRRRVVVHPSYGATSPSPPRSGPTLYPPRLLRNSSSSNPPVPLSTGPTGPGSLSIHLSPPGQPSGTRVRIFTIAAAHRTGTAAIGTSVWSRRGVNPVRFRVPRTRRDRRGNGR
mgnify:CR=1 FL=1|jgi:hypothetical protein